MDIFEIDGAGNNFALLSFLHEESFYKEHYKSLTSDKFIKNICDSALGHPVDGLILIPPIGSAADQKQYDFSWEFFNSDGSQAEMCGNAARAICWWFYENENKKSEISFLASKISVKALIHGLHSVEVTMRKVKTIGKAATGHYLYDSGVPHVVVFIPDDPEVYSDGEIHFEESKSWQDLARKLRYPVELDSKGANVTLVWPSPHVQKVSAITFERGVENWTMACGTGAMAAAYYANQLMGFDFPIEVRMPGGLLQICETPEGTSLKGPAKVLQKIDLNLGQYW